MAAYAHTGQNSSQRALAMALALASAVVLSPLYVTRKTDARNYETKLSSGFVLPILLAGLIIAIRTTSSSSSTTASYLSAQRGGGGSLEASWVLRIGSSSWGLAGILVMLMIVLSWQESVQEFFWR